MLYEFLTSNREELISRCRLSVAKRSAPRATEREIEYGIPVFLSQLIRILHQEDIGPDADSGSGSLRAEVVEGIGTAARSHGNELLLMGFTVDQVVYDYGDLCQAITELAVERDARITNAEFQTLNRCLDDAIADAVSEFLRERNRVTTDATAHAERLGSLADEMRNLVNEAILAMDAIRKGRVGIAGATGAVLNRSLMLLQERISGALVDVRLRAGISQNRQRVSLSKFIEEIRPAAAIDARARGLELIVPEVEAGLTMEIDPHILAGALANLLENAFKFSMSEGSVVLKAYSSADRLLIEVEDECGGLPLWNTEDPFRTFEQQNNDRSGVGLCCRGVEANGGKLRMRSIPGKGCVFTIDLPRSARDKNTGNVVYPAA